MAAGFPDLGFYELLEEEGRIHAGCLRPKKLEQKIHILMDERITPRWMSVADAGKYASMSRPNIMKHIAAGDFRAAKEGKWRIDRESIDHYLLAQCGEEDVREEARKILSTMGRRKPLDRLHRNI